MAILVISVQHRSTNSHTTSPVNECMVKSYQNESFIIIIIIINEYYLGAVKSPELLEHLTWLT